MGTASRLYNRTGSQKSCNPLHPFTFTKPENQSSSGACSIAYFYHWCQDQNPGASCLDWSSCHCSGYRILEHVINLAKHVGTHCLTASRMGLDWSSGSSLPVITYLHLKSFKVEAKQNCHKQAVIYTPRCAWPTQHLAVPLTELLIRPGVPGQLPCVLSEGARTGPAQWTVSYDRQ